MGKSENYLFLSRLRSRSEAYVLLFRRRRRWRKLFCVKVIFSETIRARVKIIYFCFACEAEARHMYCFSGVVVFLSRLRSRSETYVLLFRRRRCRHRRWRHKLFCVKVIFSETIRARAMKLGSCIHLKELRSTPCSVLTLDLLFTVHGQMSSFCVQVIFSETKKARAMKLGSCIYLEELSSTLCSILRLDLLFTVH